MKSLLFTLILMLAFSQHLLACSIPEEPASTADEQTYVFVGEVIGYGDKITSDKFVGEARAVKIKPVKVINLPSTPKDYLELFTFKIGAGCEAIADANDFPIGAKLKVIANTAKLLPAVSSDNHIRIEKAYQGKVAEDSSISKFETSVDSRFDYRDWKPTLAEIRQSKDNKPADSFFAFIGIEIFKDLLRLQKSRSISDKSEILNRLVYCKGIDFSRIVRLNTEENSKEQHKIQPTEALKLLQKREELEKTGYFKS